MQRDYLNWLDFISFWFSKVFWNKTSSWQTFSVYPLKWQRRNFLNLKLNSIISIKPSLLPKTSSKIPICDLYFHIWMARDILPWYSYRDGYSCKNTSWPFLILLFKICREKFAFFLLWEHMDFNGSEIRLTFIVLTRINISGNY